MVNRVISSRVAVVLTVLLMLPIPGTMGVLIEGAGTAQSTAGPSSRATGSRAGENVTIHGRIEDAGGTPPARAILVAADVNASQLINYTITTDGNYALEVPNETTYFFMMVPFTDTTLDGWDLHGYFPIVRYLTVTDVDLESNFTIEPAYEIILKGHNRDYELVDEGNFTNTAWSTNMDDISAKAVWSEVDDGTGFKLPSVLIPLGETRDL